MLIKISPSLMCMNLLKLEEQISFFNNCADYLHVDIMDNHFVPNITLSPLFIEAIKPVSKIDIDAHLMVTNPELLVEELARVGANMISYQVETINGQAYRLFAQTRKLGCKVGIVINPETNFDTYELYLPRIDKITFMSVDPGFAGQTFIPEILDKVKKVADYKSINNLNYQIEIDGSCNKNTFSKLIKAGAEVLVLGSSGLFGLADTLDESWKMMIHNIEASYK